MNQNERLLTLGSTLRKYLDVLKHAEKNIELLGHPDHMKIYETCKTPESKLSQIKRDLRHAFGELLTFNEPEAKAMPITYAMNCFTQDWDSLLDSINEVSIEFTSKQFFVDSWGHIYPKIDVNFLKQIRNAIAHSKFDYNFDTDQINISLYKDTFKVHFYGHTLLGTPTSLWELHKNSTSNNAWVDCSFTVNDTNDKNLYAFILKNSDSPLHPIITERLPDDIKENMSLRQKISIFKLFCQKQLEIYHKSSDAVIKDLKKIARQCGLKIDHYEKVDIIKYTYKNNEFLKLLASTVYENNPRSIEELHLRGSAMRPSKNFMGNPYYHTLVTCAFPGSGNSIAKNVSILSENHAPYYLDQMYDYAERSYFNYVFNYLNEKIGIDEEFKNCESIISGLTNAELMDHLRNSIVHPGRMNKQDNTYKITDYNRRKELTFNQEITTSTLLDYADTVLRKMQEKTLSITPSETEK